MKKFLFILFALSLFNFNLDAQSHYNSFVNENYAGPFSTLVQPASLAENRYKWAIGFGANYTYNNNYLGNNFNNFIHNSPDKSAYRNPVFKGYYTEMIEATVFTGFLEITPTDAIGYSIRYKEFTNYDGLEDELSLLDFNSFTNPDTTPFTQGKLSFQQMKWVEHNLTYSRTIIDKRSKFLKAGLTFKILNGVNARFLYTEGGEVQFNTNNQLSYDNLEFKYGQSDNKNQLFSSNIGIGMDLGAVYEYRPKYKDFYYKMDRRRKNPSKHENKYKYKIGASITNIGSLKYTKDTNSYNFVNDNGNTIDYKELFDSKLSRFILNDDIAAVNTNNQDDKDTNFRMRLPTALNLQFDYLLLPNIYLNYSGSFPIWGKNDPSKIHDLMINTIGARYEKPNFSVGLPVSFQRNGQVNVGAYARIRNVFFGANNINMILGQRRMYNVNVYAGITFGRLHKKPSDIDNDLVSDKLDLCPTDSGTWKMKGCPDADGDRIPDYKDFCPYVKGPRKYNGCPDTDRDGIMDYEDACPTQKGFRINNGCPDTDKDGIIDTVDRCPTIPGVYENNGCPLEQLTCCQDSDGDGLNDNIDSCVNEPGPADNFGCPTSRRKVSRERVRYPRVEKVDIETLLDNNKKDIEKMTVAEVLDDMVTMDYVNVYFDSDKSNVRTQYKTKLGTFATKVKMNANTLILILGHTDSDGSLDYNMKLSNKRSEQTKKYLISKGIDANRIVIKNYGEEKPAESNDSEEDKSKNRRVEVRMMKLNN